MTLTVLTPAVGPAGPGETITVHSSTVGPIATTDIILVEVVPSGDSGNVCSGAVRSDGSHDFTVVLGQDNLVFASVIGGAQRMLADGASCDLQLIRYDAVGNIQETGSSTGWTYRSTSALWNLMRGIVTHDPMLDSILAAVRRTFPAS